MSKGRYEPGGDAKAIAEVAKARFGSFKGMFEHHGWPERGSDMRKVQTRVADLRQRSEIRRALCRFRVTLLRLVF